MKRRFLKVVFDLLNPNLLATKLDFTRECRKMALQNGRHKKMKLTISSFLFDIGQ